MLVKDYHIDQVASGRMPCYEYPFRTPSATADFLESPGHGRSGIVDYFLDFDLGQKPVVYSDDSYTGFLQGCRDVLMSPRKSSAVEPDQCGKALDISRVVEIQDASFGRIFSGVGMIGDTLLELVAALSKGNLGKCQEQYCQ